MAVHTYQHTHLITTTENVQRFLEMVALGQADYALSLNERYIWADAYVIVLLGELVPALPGYLQAGVLACLALRDHIKSSEYLAAYYAAGGQ